MKLILASNSPRRKEILSKFNFEFDVITSDFKEETKKDFKNEYEINSLIKKNCYCKANAIKKEIASQAIVIGADTVVTLDSVCLIKPQGFTEAFSCLKNLSGKKHKVKTAIAVIGKRENVQIIESIVYFRKLKDEEIENYINIYKPYDKAGSYGIQDFISPDEILNPPKESFIEKIEGSYYNIMGICPYALSKMLEDELN